MASKNDKASQAPGEAAWAADISQPGWPQLQISIVPLAAAISFAVLSSPLFTTDAPAFVAADRI